MKERKHENKFEDEPNIVVKCFACGFQNDISKKEHPFVFGIYKKQGAVICQQCGLKFSIPKKDDR